ncbi:MAG: hypothetical protein SPG09_11620 [Lachnospiraceae bacterium]|nr:hypothetical protein [bacterium]MDY5518239.1 hypothetical protein [Lachnospiraceae bacterium]
MKHTTNLLPKNFFICGLTGWCIEIVFTSLKGLHQHDHKLLGQTSIWMFPIYGCAALIKPMYHLIGRLPAAIRGGIYSAAIFAGEYVSGSILKKHNCCPWDYSRARFNIRGVIRLDYAPLWMGAGLLFERILGCKKTAK